MGSKFLKVLGALVVAYIAFFTYSYFFGSMYGGKEYQRKSLEAGAQYLLKQYRSQQEIYFSEKHEYDRALHTKEPYSTSKDLLLAFADDPTVKNVCGDCVFTPSKYKIAVVGKNGDRSYIWTIDNSGTLVSLQ